MIRYKIYDAAGPTPSFLGDTTKPEIDVMTETRIVETSMFRDGRFKGETLRLEFIGRFDFDRGISVIDELRVLVNGERHERMKFDRPLDIFNSDFGWALDDAADRGVRFIGNVHANGFSGDVEDDRLLGGGGDDRLEGSSGDDVLRGGVGADRLTNEWGNDRLLGGDGADRLTVKRGNDRLTGGAGDDWLRDLDGKTCCAAAAGRTCSGAGPETIGWSAARVTIVWSAGPMETN